MITWWHIYLLVFAMASGASLIATAFFMKLALKINFTDNPKMQDHKNHKKATPLLGGMAMMSAWVLTIVLGYLFVFVFNGLEYSVDLQNYAQSIKNVSGRMFFIVLGAILITVLGLLDDKFSLNAKTKFTGQALIAAIAVFLGGVKLTCFIDFAPLTYAISIFWFLLLINAINFFDNMDGLAAGTAAIALMFFTITAAINQQYFIAIMSALSFGSICGFWFFNHNPASIFMGDSGSHFLGYILAVISTSVSYFSHDTSSTYLPVLIPLFILAIPLFDTIAVVIIRLRNHKPIYIGDNNHISHRFEQMGMTRKQSVFMVHLLALIIGFGVLPLLWGNVKTSIVLIIQALLLLLLVSYLQCKLKIKDKKENPELDSTPPPDDNLQK